MPAIQLSASWLMRLIFDELASLLQRERRVSQATEMIIRRP